MSETAILAAVVGALWGIVLALLGVVWATLKERLSAAEAKTLTLETQNTAQETMIGRLTERMTAREDAHAEHRDAMSNRLERIEDKLDWLLSGRSGTPYPGRYGASSDKPSGER